MKKARQNLRVAINHGWLATFGGSERVVEQMLKIFPDADQFSTLAEKNIRSFQKLKSSREKS